MSKLKAFADNNMNVTSILKFVCEQVENITENEKNASYKRFIHFPQFFLRVVQTQDCKGIKLVDSIVVNSAFYIISDIIHVLCGFH